MQVDPLQERRVNAVILSEAKNLGFRFELLAAVEERSGRGEWSLTIFSLYLVRVDY